MEGHTDFYRLLNGVMYWDEILRASVRTYAGAVGPMLVMEDEEQVFLVALYWSTQNWFSGYLCGLFWTAESPL